MDRRVIIDNKDSIVGIHVQECIEPGNGQRDAVGITSAGVGASGDSELAFSGGL
jgi:hypothetical protein